MVQKYSKEANKAVWGTSPAGWNYAQEFKPGTKDFFEKAYKKRLEMEYYLYGVVKFDNYKNKNVLEIGCGAGFDAYSFCKAGARYTGIDLVPENKERTEKHLQLYGYTADIRVMDAEHLDALNKKFDFIYSLGVLHHIEHIENVLQHIKNVLNDSGTALCTVYNRSSIFYWCFLYLYEWLWCKQYKQYSSFNDRLARIENTESSAIPYIKVYTKKEFVTLLEKNGFKIKKVTIAGLTKESIPPFFFIHRFYKYIPQLFLKIIGGLFGWYICVEFSKK